MRDLITLLKTSDTFDQIDAAKEKIADVMPAIRIMFGYDQKNSSHQYDLWGHSVYTLLNLPHGIEDNMLYVAALLHDIGKPYSRCFGKREGDSDMHYYGHPQKSLEIVRDVVIPGLEERNIRLGNEEKARLFYFVEYHDDRVSLRPKHLRRHLKIASFEEFRHLMLLEVADAKAHVMFPQIENRIAICSQWAGEYGQSVFDSISEPFSP